MLRNEIIGSIRRRMRDCGLLRVPDADPDRFQPGGRARLPGALAHASGQVLRPAAGAAAVQAADHDRGLRPLLPDRALLPRRGCARRSLARRVLPARPRDELRRAGGRVRRRRARHARPVRGVRRRQAGDAEVPAHRLRRGDPEVRLRQAGPAQPHRHGRRDRAFPRLGLQGVRGHDREGPQGAGVGDPCARRRQPRLLRPHERLGAEGRPAGARLHLLAEKARKAAQDPSPRTSGRSATGAIQKQLGLKVGRRRVLRRRQPGQVLQVRRRGAHAWSGAS